MKCLFALALLTACAIARADSSVLDAAPLERLKQAYLACDQRMSMQRVDAATGAACSAVGDALLRRGFGGDLDALLAWRRDATDSARQGPRMPRHAP